MLARLRIEKRSSPEKPHVSLPVGRCIYCGKTPPEAVLTKEHITPLGLGGSAILLKASCEECRRITHAFETPLMKDMLLSFRTHAKMRSRRPKERPTHLPLRKHFNVPGENVLVPVEDHPFTLPLPLFGPPGILEGRPYGLEIIKYHMTNFGNWTDVQKIADKYGGSIVQEHKIYLPEFLRLLAKMAHGYAWLMVGPDNFRPMLNGVILGKDNDLTYLVGQLPPIIDFKAARIKGTTHGIITSLRQHGNITLVIVHMHLFHFNVPPYCAVAGELIASEDWLARHGLFREGAILREDPQWQSDKPPAPIP